MLTIDATDEGATQVFHLRGVLDGLEAGELKKRVRTAIASGCRDVLLDFTDTSFADSAGLGALVALQKTASAAGARFRLRRLRDHVRAVLELTRLHKFFEIVESG